MYAQMCKVLVEKAPNFDPPDSNACTFKRLLLNKCRVEFENRVQIAQQYEKYARWAESFLIFFLVKLAGVINWLLWFDEKKYARAREIGSQFQSGCSYELCKLF